MKYTLLDMVQDVLSSMDSDEVNSISDNTEAQQVARVIRACYFDVISNKLPETTTLLQLDPSNDVTKPVLMYVPEDVHNFIFVRYDKQLEDATTSDFTDVTPLSVEDFFNMTQSLSLDDTNVEAMNHNVASNTFEFLYRNDKSPDYYTCIDNRTIFFDSYDAAVDATLQKAKTFCMGEKETVFSSVDAYEIDLNEKEHVWLLNEAKALAFQELKQQTHAYAEKTSKRQRIKAQKNKYVNDDHTVYYNSLPIFGRKGRNPTPAIIMH